MIRESGNIYAKVGERKEIKGKIDNPDGLNASKKPPRLGDGFDKENYIF